MTTALEGGEGSASRPGRSLLPGKTRYPLFRRLGGPEPVLTGAENLALSGIQSPDRPARSQSLYRLGDPVHYQVGNTEILFSKFQIQASTAIQAILEEMSRIFSVTSSHVAY